MLAPMGDSGQAVAAGVFLALVFAAPFGLLMFGSWQAGVAIVFAVLAGIGIGVRLQPNQPGETRG